MWTDAFGNKAAISIRPYMVEEVMAKKSTEGYKPATIHRALTTLKSIFNRALKNEIIEKNPIAIVSAPKYDNTIVRYLTPDKESRLFEALPERLYPIVIVAMHTGLRQGDLLNLIWEDIDFNARTMFIRNPKSGESRFVLMNTCVESVLLSLPGRDISSAPVFTDTLGGQMDARNLRRDFKQAIENAGLAPFRFHDLRHSFASRLAMLGSSDRTLQTLLGHKTQRMLLRYAHLGQNHLLNALEGLVTVSPPKIGTDTKTDTKEILTIEGEQKNPESLDNTGAGNGIRTRDPRLGKAMLYR